MCIKGVHFNRKSKSRFFIIHQTEKKGKEKETNLVYMYVYNTWFDSSFTPTHAADWLMVLES